VPGAVPAMHAAELFGAHPESPVQAPIVYVPVVGSHVTVRVPRLQLPHVNDGIGALHCATHSLNAHCALQV
jgi:hypothetical protein